MKGLTDARTNDPARSFYLSRIIVKVGYKRRITITNKQGF